MTYMCQVCSSVIGSHAVQCSHSHLRSPIMRRSVWASLGEAAQRPAAPGPRDQGPHGRLRQGPRPPAATPAIGWRCMYVKI